MSGNNTKQLQEQERAFQESQQRRRKQDEAAQRAREKARHDAAVRGAMGGGRTCFPADTLVATANGAVKIAAVREGDLVTAVDSRHRVAGDRRVVKVLRHRASRIWSIRFADGRTVRSSASHSFLVGSRWVEVRHLREGQLVSMIGASGDVTSHRVARVNGTDQIEEVFNLVVERDFTFLADGFIVHCFTHLRSARVLYWRARLALLGWRRAGGERSRTPRVAQPSPA